MVLMDSYVALAITACGLVVSGGIAWGVLKTTVTHLSTEQGKQQASLDTQESRLRNVEMSQTSWLAHVKEAPNVLERLRGIERCITEIQVDLRNRGETVVKIQDVLEANRLVLSDIAQAIAVMQAVRE